ncbi:MAG: S8 family serine peptidase [Cytophagaceae bacterium]|nr:S8 family serine peptidase [Gemmatimonadaceae bacterium]
MSGTYHAYRPGAVDGAGLRIAIVDSGIAPGHPHVGSVEGGVSLVGENRDDTSDRLGHGTAVAAAVREKLPAATLVPIRVLDAQLATSARILAEAITWAVNDGARLINLSLGTTNAVHMPLFESALALARERGALVVSASGDGLVCWYPGSLPGVVGVTADADCPRFAIAVRQGALGPGLAASPWPRPIPGVVTERNLSGVSFAVANATGLLGRLLATRPDLQDAAAVLHAIQGASTDGPPFIREDARSG